MKGWCGTSMSIRTNIYLYLEFILMLSNTKHLCSEYTICIGNHVTNSFVLITSILILTGVFVSQDFVSFAGRIEAAEKQLKWLPNWRIGTRKLSILSH